ncbi:NAD-P-binding protein [Russula compacta]|nr:NAD-P-binding protein [Russula compacta]
MELESLPGFDEDLKVTVRHDVYPFIDPKVLYDAQAFAGKVVLITGASRGIGLETAVHFARAGASLTIVARKQEALDASRNTILREQPSAQVLTFPADVRDVKKTAEAIAATVAHYGRLDVLVANAAILRPSSQPFASEDPTEWWQLFEVNIRGTYNFVHFAVPELQKTKGRIVIVSSAAAQLRIPFTSDYCTSKHALLRFAEFISIEYPEIKTFSVHPGVVATDLTSGYEGRATRNEDTPALPAATILYVVSGKADYLSGRFIASNWDLGEVERDWKEKIISQQALVSKLHIPQ